MVRTGPKRTKADWDTLAAKLEDRWYEIVKDEKQTGDANADDEAAKKMHLITFYPMLAARENGVTIPDVCLPSASYLFPALVSPPRSRLKVLGDADVVAAQAGTESSWLRDYMPFFKAQAYEHGDEDFRKMLNEIETREDLKALLNRDG
ncbi:hypothetical protein A1O7_07012 [Cladophialophora yegresii CBS 114405]|uniref:Uncharacterized protein n=1 Tax=Cladophialophora yegresii CBS 114405 TaxID=1182544 RepID=W9VMB7_9EURO|nr:uncharacterized protein A1O7_07012 [Cladophialophora yegresii CBS 114405]EXJ56668.1 hypothetical protein A1O7_07012 [Cladophialophora yegresii CBS 114405]